MHGVELPLLVLMVMIAALLVLARVIKVPYPILLVLGWAGARVRAGPTADRAAA